MQIAHLIAQGDLADAHLLALMESTPSAVWFTGTTPSGDQQTPRQVEMQARLTMLQAALQRAVPVLVVYNIPGRDCSQYSAGGAPSDAAYQAWVSGLARGIGWGKAVVLVEPDGLANLPSNCSYAGEPNAPTDTSRIADIKYAVSAFEQDPNVAVYLDGGHSAWQPVGTIAQRLVEAGVADAQGFFLNVSNYQYATNNVFYGTWVSECIALGGGSLTYDYADNCPNQYWNGGPATSWQGTALSPYGVWSDSSPELDLSTAGIGSRYASLLGTTVPTTHFVIDTSRDGAGPNDMALYASAPYDQPQSVISTLQSGNWCNPVGAGLGARPTAGTSSISPLLDAYLWVKIPGQSDGQCDAAGGVRAWDNSAYTPPVPGWPSTTDPSFSTFDPLWSIQTGTLTTDPAAGQWFPAQALQLAQDAVPPLGS